VLLVATWVAPRFLSIHVLPVAVVISTIIVAPEAQNTSVEALITTSFPSAVIAELPPTRPFLSTKFASVVEIAPFVLQLQEVGDFEAQNCLYAPNFINCTTDYICTSAAIFFRCC
jgi:hypothetical protein